MQAKRGEASYSIGQCFHYNTPFVINARLLHFFLSWRYNDSYTVIYMYTDTYIPSYINVYMYIHIDCIPHTHIYIYTHTHTLMSTP